MKQAMKQLEIKQKGTWYTLCIFRQCNKDEGLYAYQSFTAAGG